MRTTTLLVLVLASLGAGCGGVQHVPGSTLPEVLLLARGEHGTVRDLDGHSVEVQGGDVTARLADGRTVPFAPYASATIAALPPTELGSLVVTEQGPGFPFRTPYRLDDIDYLEVHGRSSGADPGWVAAGVVLGVIATLALVTGIAWASSGGLHLGYGDWTGI